MKWGRTILVIIGALIITTLGIDAADTLQGSHDTLLSRVISYDQGKCPNGMSVVENIPTMSCVDTFEASPGEKCPASDPDQMLASIRNIEAKECLPKSTQDALPWRFITRDQAMQMCARAGKRIPTNDEWHALSLGMTEVETSCNVFSKSVARAGSASACVSPHGAYDLIGNVWEWVSDDVIDGTYKSAAVPNSGYVAQVDSGGMTTVSSEDPQELFGKDYFWSQKSGAFGMIRGGYYDSGTDAGIYTIHADTIPTSASIGIGFRCVK